MNELEHSNLTTIHIDYVFTYWRNAGCSVKVAEEYALRSLNGCELCASLRGGRE